MNSKMQHELRRPAKPSCGASKNTRIQGVRMEKGIGTGTLRNRHVEGNRGGIEGADACQATRIVQRTAKAWEVK